MRRFITFALLLLMLPILASCGGAGANTASEEEKTIVLGYAQVGAESDWRTANTLSIKTAAEEAGIQLMFADAQQKPENQIKAIRKFIANQVDVIAFSPIIETGWDTVLKEAKDAGIPVITLDRAIRSETNDQSLYVTLIGSDFKEEGRSAARWLVKKMKDVKGDINIAELQGTIDSSPAIDRKEGFEEVIKDYPNMHIIISESADFLRSEGYEMMQSMLQKEGSKINVLFSHNDDMAIGAVKAIEEYGLKPGKDIVIVSIDGIKDAFTEMLAGKINCTVECNPLLGPQLMQAVKDIVKGKKLPKRIYSVESVFPEEVAASEIGNRKY